MTVKAPDKNSSLPTKTQETEKAGCQWPKELQLQNPKGAKVALASPPGKKL